MAAGQNVGAELANQDWLFRQGGLVLGPVSGQQLVEKLYAGELSSDTEVTPAEERRFRPLAEVGIFRVHLAKAEAKARVEATLGEERTATVRKRMVLAGVLGSLTLVLALGAWRVAHYAAVHGGPLVSDEEMFADISVEPPTVTVARARADEEWVEYPSQGKRGAKPAGGTASEKALVAHAGGKERKALAPAGAKLTAASDDPDGMQVATFDQSAINGVVAKNQRSLFPCFADEARRSPGFAAKVPIEFVIGNDGRVAKLWVDHPQLKQGALFECLLAQLQKWPFKPYDGERATVGLSFKVGKPG